MGKRVDRKEAPSQIETLQAPTEESEAVGDLQVPTLTILFHPDTDRIGELVRLHELPADRPIKLSRLEPTFAAPAAADRKPLADAHLSRQPIVLRPIGADQPGVVVDRAASQARVDIDGVRLAAQHTVASSDLSRGVVLVLGRRVVLLLHHHHARLGSTPRYGLIGESSPMVRLRHEIQATANFEASVLLRGETGTGKELVARAIHAAGPRRERPFVSVNLAAIPASLAASELFGAARGAYTGADRRKDGFFARARGGTLFLDEIGETPTEVQPLLLRALEDGEIQPVGSMETRHVDVRVIAATDADLESAIATGQFRSPLLHRLAGYEIHLPPLRERSGDFGRLFFHFLHEELIALGQRALVNPTDVDARPWPPVDWIVRMAQDPWPGNVRQLRNIARRLAVAQCNEDPILRMTTLEKVLEPAGESAHQAPSERPPSREAVASREQGSAPRSPGTRRAADVSEEELLRCLEQHAYERKRTAEALGISRGALYYLIDQCPRVRKATDLEPAEIASVIERSGGDLIATSKALGVSRQALKRRMHGLGLR